MHEGRSSRLFLGVFAYKQNQGCPIGIPKNPEISGSSRKSSLGAAEEVHSAPKRFTRRARNAASLKSGGGG